MDKENKIEKKDLHASNSNKRSNKSKNSGKRNYSDHTAANSSKPYGNDFSMWNKYPELMANAANVPFNWRPGLPLGLNSQGYKYMVPGAIRVVLENTYGVANSATDAINVFARAAWLDMHRKYRGIGTYEAADLGIVMVATAEIFALIAKIERIYGSIARYRVDNLNFPSTIIEALDLPIALANNIRANLADFRYQLNRVINKAQSLCAFKGFEAIRDRISLYGYIYKDYDKYDAQAIIFDCVRFGKYEATTLKTGGCVHYTGRFPNSSTDTYLDIIKYLEDRVDALVGSDDVQRIYSDMLAAYSDADLIRAMLVPEDYYCDPVYDVPMLHKWHNAYFACPCYTDQGGDTCYPVLGNAAMEYGTTGKPFLNLTDAQTALQSGRFIFQQDGLIHCNYSLCFADKSQVVYTGHTSTAVKAGVSSVSAPWNNNSGLFVNTDSKFILDIGDESISEEKIVEGALFKPVYDIDNLVSTGEPKIVVIESCALEVPLFMQIFINTQLGAQQLGSGVIGSMIDGANADFPQEGEFLELTKFDWHPLVYTILKGSQPDVIMGDLNKSTLYATKDLVAIHQIATLSALKILGNLVPEK